MHRKSDYKEQNDICTAQKKKNNKETQKFYKKQIDQSVRNSHVE